MNNEKRLQEYRKKKLIKILILILSVVIVILEFLAICKIIHYIWGLIVFIIAYLIKKANK